MDIFKAQLARLRQQLSGLTASQKMLAGALVAIMAMTLIWWGRYAGEPEYRPLLNQSFTPDEISTISAGLDAKGIKYTVAVDRILVPSDRQQEALGELSFHHMLPDRTDAGFDEMIKQMNPWDPADKTNHFWVEAKQRTLSAILENFPTVRQANVVLDITDQRRFDGHDTYPTAMVNLLSRDLGGNHTVRELAGTAADLVAGAVSGLARSRVVVVVDGGTIPIPDKDGIGGSLDGDTIMQATRANEIQIRDKIKELYNFIPGLLVSVNIRINTKSSDTHETIMDPKTSAHLEQTIEEKTVDTSSPIGGAEPGAAANLANAPVAVGGAVGGGAATSSETDTKTSFQNVVGSRESHIMQGPGDVTTLAASLRVPRSYFIQAYKDQNKGADPDEAALAALFTKEAEQIAKDVMNCTGIEDPAKIAVSLYSDGLGLAASALSSGSSGAGVPVSALLTSHARDIGVSGLAMVSLFMVMMMVRKGTPMAATAAVADEKDENPALRLQPESQLAGEVSEGDKTLDGMELDEESIKTQQMVDQVSSMVTENPDAAANLVKRWLNRS